MTQTCGKNVAKCDCSRRTLQPKPVSKQRHDLKRRSICESEYSQRINRRNATKTLAHSYPDYKYQPVYRRTGAPRRQIKADPVEVKKCTLVANLLLDGKKGEELKKEAKKAVERSNKKRAKVAKSLAEAR